MVSPEADERQAPLRVEIAGLSDTGRVRRMNQDRVGIAEDLGLAVVCDGMGGPPGGDVASNLAVESFLAVVRQETERCSAGHDGMASRSLHRAAAAANRAVRLRASYDTRFRGMGTTLVAACLERSNLVALNVGDSRCYLIRNSVARQITRDHSYVAEQVRKGMMSPLEAERSTLQSVITQAIGTEEDVHPDLFSELLDAGDIALLCSDGLTRHVHDEELGRLIWGSHTTKPLNDICGELVSLANERGGSDNITCVLMRFAAADFR